LDFPSFFFPSSCKDVAGFFSPLFFSPSSVAINRACPSFSSPSLIGPLAAYFLFFLLSFSFAQLDTSPCASFFPFLRVQRTNMMLYSPDYIHRIGYRKFVSSFFFFAFFAISSFFPNYGKNSWPSRLLSLMVT